MSTGPPQVNRPAPDQATNIADVVSTIAYLEAGTVLGLTLAAFTIGVGTWAIAAGGTTGLRVTRLR